MGFDNTLNYFMQQACCTSKELAQASGVSQTVVSRYRNAKRTPSPDSDSISKLAEALESLASENGITLKKEDIENSLRLSLEKVDDEIDTDALVNNLNSLVSVLGINVANLARAINYDPSHLSRIRALKRKPSNPSEFARKIAEYTVRKYDSEEDREIIANLTGSSGDNLQTALELWLCNGSLNNKDCIFDFLTSLNNFNLDEYIESIHFNVKKKIREDNLFDYKFFITDNIEFNQETYNEIYNKLNTLMATNKTLIVNKQESQQNSENNFNKIDFKKMEFITSLQAFKDELFSTICSNKYEVVNYLIKIFYEEKKTLNKANLWRLCGQELYEIAYEKNNGIIDIPKRDDKGDIRFWNKDFSVITVDLKEENELHDTNI